MFINFLYAYKVFNEIFSREVLVTPSDVQFRKFIYIFVCLLIWCQCFLFFQMKVSCSMKCITELIHELREVIVTSSRVQFHKLLYHEHALIVKSFWFVSIPIEGRPPEVLH